jgi:hypothetical protein
MRRQHKFRHRHRSGTQQFDLFREPGGDGATQRPEWRSLPMQTREALTELMVRLILDHAKESCRPRLGEARHDV